MDLGHIPLKLKDRGQLGSGKILIDLEAVQPVTKKSEILSEGEQRALALAGFLAELREIGGNHGIIINIGIFT